MTEELRMRKEFVLSIVNFINEKKGESQYFGEKLLCLILVNVINDVTKTGVDAEVV